MSSIRSELISHATRIALRELANDVKLREIDNAWQSEQFEPTTDPATLRLGGERRALFQSYLNAVDWTDDQHVARAVRVVERFLSDHFIGSNKTTYHRVRRELERDGYSISNDGRITKHRFDLHSGCLTDLTDPSAIHDGLQRLRRAEQHEDPALVIGAAKELIESTAKLVLKELGQVPGPRANIQELVRSSQKELGLLPSRASTSGPDSTEAIRKILNSSNAIAVGVAELRNRGYGTGHGPAGPRHGLTARHAHLAANAAITWCELILETLADPRAPWRTPRCGGR